VGCSTFHGLAWAPQPTNLGTSTPEVPVVLALPILGAGLFGGYLVYRRRQQSPDASGPAVL
jgi:hypothetical protein